MTDLDIVIRAAWRAKERADKAATDMGVSLATRQARAAAAELFGEFAAELERLRELNLP